MPRLFHAALAALCLAASLALPTDANAAEPVKVAIIVGPVGDLTPTYLHLAEAAAASAERHGATVARAYSPNATPGNVLAAVADAQIVIYFGHGYGHPSPYGGLNAAKQNGWALQGPRARGTHADSSSDGSLEYYGADWIVANARPAPGFVMIYSNTCYAPGASEGGQPTAAPNVAAERVSRYSQPIFALGGSAYFATDFDLGASALVDRLLADRTATYAQAFTADHRYSPHALTTQAHWFSPDRQVWLHRSIYSGEAPNWWYAFAGDPNATPLASWDQTLPGVHIVGPGSEARITDAFVLNATEPIVGVSPTTVYLTDAAGAAVPAELGYDGASGTIALRPTAPLPMSSHVTLSVTSGIADVAGNALAPAQWTFTTQRDADPLPTAVALTLEPGTHELKRFAPDGSVAEQVAIEVATPTSERAAERARLDGQPGSWFLLESGAHAGWWVAESSAAHAIGLSEEVAFEPVGTISVPVGRHALYLVSDGQVALQPGTLIVHGSKQLSVDRRAVIDGRAYDRIAVGPAAGTWIETSPSVLPAGATPRRLGPVSAFALPTAGVLPVGWATAFRLDADGRVVERIPVEITAARQVAVDQRLPVSGRGLLRIAEGELAGWWIAGTSVSHLGPIRPLADAPSSVCPRPPTQRTVPIRRYACGYGAVIA